MTDDYPELLVKYLQLEILSLVQISAGYSRHISDINFLWLPHSSVSAD